MGAAFLPRAGFGLTAVLVCFSCGGTAENEAPAVRGTVIDELGQPYPEVTVVLGNTTTVTDASGHFRADAGDRYDVTLYRPGARLIHAFQGMSIRDPILKLPNTYVASDTSRRCSVTVVLPEADTESTATELIAGLDGTVSEAGFSSNFGTGATQRPYSVRWDGDETVELVLYAFEYEVDQMTGGPARYLRSAEIRRPISSGENVTVQVEFGEMKFATTLIEALAILPNDYRVWNVRLFVQANSVSTPFWFLTAAPGGPFASLLGVDLPGATYTLRVLASGRGSSTGRTISGFTLPTPALEVTLEPGPGNLAPIPGANDVGLDTTFSWENGAAGVAFLNILPVDSPDAPEYRIAVSGSEARFPNLSAFGVELPAGAQYEWAVFVTTAPSLDVLAEHGGEIADLPQRTYAYSGYREFTTR